MLNHFDLILVAVIYAAPAFAHPAIDYTDPKPFGADTEWARQSGRGRRGLGGRWPVSIHFFNLRLVDMCHVFVVLSIR